MNSSHARLRALPPPAGGGLAINRRQCLGMIAANALSSLSVSFASTAAYPNRPTKWLVGAPPGGPGDFIARLYAHALTPILGQVVAIENKPGASGTLAAMSVAKSAPDGYTLLLSGPSAISAAPFLLKLGYVPSTELVPVGLLGAGPLVLAVSPDVPANSVKEFVAFARANPGEIAYGSAGNGSSGHLCTEMFSQAVGIRLIHAAYKGDGQALQDLLAGRLQAMFTSANVALPFTRAGQLRLLAVTSTERVAEHMEIPTIAETVAPGFEYLGWTALFAPAGTPKEVIDALGNALAQVRESSEIRSRLSSLSMSAPERLASGEPFAQFLSEESARIGKLIRDTGIRVE